MNGATSLVKSLEAAGVDVMFGIPGGAILPAYDPIFDSSIRHILVRHEQGAGHAATGYAQVSGRAGVCIATSGPGATNLVTPLADAAMDSVPLVAITGQVPSAAIGTDAFQEADIRGITMPFTKHNYLVTDPADIPRAIAEAFHIATTGRPGPVLVDIAKDALQKETVFNWPTSVSLKGYQPTIAPNAQSISDAAALITQSHRPVFYVGGGIIKANASKELREIAELLGAPVVTTLMALGSFPHSHPLHMGMPGMHGSVAAVTALQKSDLLITLGARFDDRVTGKLSTFAVNAKVIHCDVDPAEIGKNRFADVPVVGDLKHTLIALIPALKAALAKNRPDLSTWLRQVNNLKSTYPLGYDKPSDGSVSPQYVIERIAKLSAPDSIYVAGVGQHQMWAAQSLEIGINQHFLTSGGMGAMGFALPASIGACLAVNKSPVIVLIGDGCMQLNIQELQTISRNKLPIKIIVFNNESLGMIRQFQDSYCESRYQSTSWGYSAPDFEKVAIAYGIQAKTINNEKEVLTAINWLWESNNESRPQLLQVMINPHTNTYPKLAFGRPITEMEPFVKPLDMEGT